MFPSMFELVNRNVMLMDYCYVSKSGNRVTE